MNPVQNIQTTFETSAGGIPSDVRLRRRLLYEINTIENALRSTSRPDNLSESLLEWAELFRQALNVRGQEQEILDAAKRSLQEYLKDPITNELLERNALLGSDGNTYAPQTIDMYRRLAPEALRNHSPLNPSDHSSFTTHVHPHVGRMLAWLRGESNFALGRVSRAERLRAILGDEPAPETTDTTETDQAMIDRMVAYASEGHARIRTTATVSQHARQTQIEAERIRIEENQALFDRETARIEEEYRVMEEECDRRAIRLENLRAGADDIDRARTTIAKIIGEIEKAPKKKKKRLWKQVLGTFTIVGLSLFATWAMTQMGGGIAASSGSRFSAFVAPTRGGGIRINGAWNF